MPTSEPNRPMNMLPFTKAPRLPNIGLTSTPRASGTRLVKRSRSASVGFGIFISIPLSGSEGGDAAIGPATRQDGLSEHCSACEEGGLIIEYCPCVQAEHPARG